jgi:hypothetical protein
VLLSMQVFRDVTLCHWVIVWLRFEGIHRPGENLGGGGGGAPQEARNWIRQPNQIANCTGRRPLGCLAIPAFDCIAGLSNRHLKL